MRKVKKAIKKLPEQKHYFEFIAAVLTIPVLITVILLNLNNLSQSKAKPTPSPTPIVKEIIINGSNSHTIEVTPTNEPNPTSTPIPTATSAVCQKTIGTIAISYPQDNQTVKDNPLCFIINHDDVNYCAVVWQYSINGSQYSNYSSNSPCIYNLPNGPVEFDLRVQSTVSNDQQMLVKKFIYQGNTPTPTPSL